MKLPRKVWVAVSVLGLFVAVTFAILPVGARFGDDPLLRLGALDPQLSPPSPTAVCGSALANLSPRPRDTSLYEVARAHACERAARKRVAASVAAGAVLVMLGLLGMAGGVPALHRDRGREPTRTNAGGLLSG